MIENQRLILIAALVFVVFLLWQNWLEFQAQKYPPPAPPTATAPVDPARPPLAAPVTGQDVPTVSPSSNPVAASPAAALPSSGQRVRVITDVFDLEIDTAGGDLRQAGLRGYPVSAKQPNQPFLLLRDSNPDLFVAQSGLVAAGDAPAPHHYATFVPEQTEYRLADGQDTLEVPLHWSDPSGLKATKTYTFQRGRFLVDIKQRLENASPTEWRGSQYRQFQRTPPKTVSSFFGSGVITYTGAVISTPEQRYQKVSFGDMAKEPLSQTVQSGWVAMIQHYFLGAWIPDPAATENFYTRKAEGAERYIAGMRGDIKTVPPGATEEFHTRLYVGPKLPDVLETIAPNLQLTVDYGTLTIIAVPLFWLLKQIHWVVGNWGWAIIFLTLLIKLAFYKLSETSYRSMANMRRLAPELTRL